MEVFEQKCFIIIFIEVLDSTFQKQFIYTLGAFQSYLEHAEICDFSKEANIVIFEVFTFYMGI